MLDVAIQKGRIGEDVYAILEKAGYGCADILSPSRKLVFEDEEHGVRYFWVRPSDVAIYVERGAADVGIAGSDVLAESRPNVYELLDLGVGKCRICVAAKSGFADPGGVLRVATKFTQIAKAYYAKRSREIDVIHLYGSIELAPLLGLSDVIVDLVETGNTLRENGLEVVETISDVSARLIANKISYKFKHAELTKLVSAVSERLGDA
ncbi:MAG: ATP phosphoribosyltransferase [Oscillospiraceae bacterium]|jgi:ATP phosphoribosyltransferase|nr:ATP phosphoribosyltransferase [Oscillospiraceae bacterium]